MLTSRGTGCFSLDGSVRIAAHDRAGLERVLRYCVRPPFALHRLRGTSSSLASPDTRLIDTLPRPDRTGRTAVQLSPIELLQRLARLIPPPFVHRHRYHGVFAPNSRWRRQATRYGPEPKPNLHAQPDEELDTDSGPEPAVGHCPHLDRGRGARRRWAQLLVRVYEIDPLRCPACDGPMRILASLTDPTVAPPILRHLSIPEHSTPLAPARAPPQTELRAVDPPSPWDRLATRSPGRDPFDQSLPGDDGTWSA